MSYHAARRICPGGGDEFYFIVNGETLEVVRSPEQPDKPIRFKTKERCLVVVNTLNVHHTMETALKAHKALKKAGE